MDNQPNPVVELALTEQQLSTAATLKAIATAAGLGGGGYSVCRANDALVKYREAIAYMGRTASTVIKSVVLGQPLKEKEQRVLLKGLNLLIARKWESTP